MTGYGDRVKGSVPGFACPYECTFGTTSLNKMRKHLCRGECPHAPDGIPLNDLKGLHQQPELDAIPDVHPPTSGPLLEDAAGGDDGSGSSGSNGQGVVKECPWCEETFEGPRAGNALGGHKSHCPEKPTDEEREEEEDVEDDVDESEEEELETTEGDGAVELEDVRDHAENVHKVLDELGSVTVEIPRDDVHLVADALWKFLSTDESPEWERKACARLWAKLDGMYLPGQRGGQSNTES